MGGEEVEGIVSCKYRSRGKDELYNVRHFHDNVAEILLVHKGTGVMTIRDKIYPLESSSIYFIRENTFHCSTPKKSEEYERSVVNISEGYLRELVRITGYDKILEKMEQAGGIMLDFEASRTAEKLFLQMSSEKRWEYSMALLKLIEMASSRGFEQNVLSNKVSQIMTYINRNIGEELSLEKISRALFISKYHMCRIFKETTRMSIAGYILSQRLSLAKNMLISTEKSISEIALTCGFSGFSYFSRVFKAKEGITAGEYRKRFSAQLD